MTPGSSSASLFKAYALCVAGALVAAIAAAALGDRWVHRSGDPALLLLPVSNVRFWFIPFTAIGCAGVALARQRRARTLVATAVLFVALAVVGAARWYRAGQRLGPNWTSADLAAVMRDSTATGIALGSLTLLGLGLFALGLRDSARS
jgi:ABC-type dipeptide/oligopeptide/nickel transport system permease subunit